MPDQEEARARETSNRDILEAERFKADIAAPQGKLSEFLNKFQNDLEVKRFFDNGDDFFHVSCHVDQNLCQKIESGEFVELERLLPQNNNKLMDMGEHHRMELVVDADATYFAPVQDRECGITNVRRWEQAFRIYAAIYTERHPERASEIWQYIYVITTAASTYNWENVAMYDFTFRKLMATKLWRSWAKTYTQGWNIALKEPLNRNMAAHITQSKSNNNTGTHNVKTKDWKDECCWRYNKNRCTRSTTDCHFDHRCTYCGGWYHGYFNRRKRNKRSNAPPAHGGGGSSTADVGRSGVNSQHSPREKSKKHSRSDKKSFFITEI